MKVSPDVQAAAFKALDRNNDNVLDEAEVGASVPLTRDTFSARIAGSTDAGLATSLVSCARAQTIVDESKFTRDRAQAQDTNNRLVYGIGGALTAGGFGVLAFAALSSGGTLLMLAGIVAGLVAVIGLVFAGSAVVSKSADAQGATILAEEAIRERDIARDDLSSKLKAFTQTQPTLAAAFERTVSK